ncbi:7834_t:CDS:2 [Scutellospora calospora]|uniref:7834_t:CDS:1 n=1 Tax=Scutellospora calospora TaxID=85575 RepID=A0ACA9KB88_9GLOM|nr:7834_t:CDS:2 [Scutellospora calospora]
MSDLQNKNTTILASSYQPQINDTFESHSEFIDKIKNYAQNLGFTIRLGKSEYLKKSENKEENALKEHNSNNEISKKERNRVSQHCGCSFYIRASLNSLNSLWYIINMNLIHNHQIVEENHRFFMSNKRNIPDDVKQ